MAPPEEIFRHLELADEELSSAYILLENGKFRDAISRAYYSMFHAAKAILLTKDISPRKHSGVIKMFGLHFVTEGFVEEIYARAFNRAFALRSRADYDVYYSPSYEEARNVVENAGSFLERIKRALGELGYETGSP